MPRIQRIQIANAGASVRHVVIGHSQVRGCWDQEFKEEYLNFPTDWICVSGGKLPELMMMIKEEIRNAHIPLCVTGIIWQNSLPDLPIQSVLNTITELEEFLKEFPEHKVALPECLFVPKYHYLFEHIARVNLILADYNKRHGFSKYSLYKSTLRGGKGKLVVVNEEYTEFLQSEGPGYHIDNKEKYTKFIKKFHFHGFGSTRNDETLPTVLTKELVANMPILIPVMNPSPGFIVDARDVIKGRRSLESGQEAETSRKDNSEKSVNLVNNAESDEEIEFICEVKREQEVQKDDQIPLEYAENIADQSEGFQITLDNSNTSAENKMWKERQEKLWLEEGTSKGYIEQLRKTERKAIWGRLYEKARKVMQKKKERKSRKKKLKRKRREVESSSSSSSSTSSSSSSSSTSSTDSEEEKKGKKKLKKRK